MAKEAKGRERWPANVSPVMMGKPLLTVMKHCFMANRPLLMVSDPGIGKTFCIKDFGRKHNALVVPLIVSQHDPTAIQGLQMPDLAAKVTLTLAPEWAKLMTEAAALGMRIILFLDELGTAPELVQAACLSLVGERMIGLTQLPAGTWIVAAMNPPETGVNGHDLGLPLVGRFTIVWVQEDVDDYIKNIHSYWDASPEYLKGLCPYLDQAIWAAERLGVATYLESNRLDLLKTPENEDEKICYPSPRAWDGVSMLMSTSDSVDEVAPTIKGTLGPAVGTKFLTWRRDRKFPKPEVVLADPTKLPTRPDEMYLCLATTVSFVKRDGKRGNPPLLPQWNALWSVFNFIGGSRQQKDIAAVYFSDMLDMMQYLPGAVVPPESLKLFLPLLIVAGMNPGAKKS